MRKMVYTYYPSPNFFADHINLEYFMQFFPSTLNLCHLVQERPT